MRKKVGDDIFSRQPYRFFFPIAILLLLFSLSLRNNQSKRSLRYQQRRLATTHWFKPVQILIRISSEHEFDQVFLGEFRRRPSQYCCHQRSCWHGLSQRVILDVSLLSPQHHRYYCCGCLAQRFRRPLCEERRRKASAASSSADPAYFSPEVQA